MFGFYFGTTPAVILADYELIKEAFKLDALAARPDLNPGWHPSCLYNDISIFHLRVIVMDDYYKSKPMSTFNGNLSFRAHKWRQMSCFQNILFLF